MKDNDIKDVLKQLDTIPLPDKEKILSACREQMPSEDIVNKATPGRRFSKKTLIAASVALIILISGFTGYTITAEAKEYNEAVAFFRDYHLSIEGLSRGEIKRVYRDITTGSFSYDKTSELIQKNIGGYEIFQEEPTPEDLESLWNYAINKNFYRVEGSIAEDKGISYKFYDEERFSEALGYEVHDKSVVEKYIDGNKAWSVEFEEFYIQNYVTFKDNVIVYGETPSSLNSQGSYAFMAMIDAEGRMLWQTRLQNGFKDEYIASVIPDGDKIAVFSRGDLRYLCLTVYDMNGKALSSYKNDIGNYGIWNAARLGEGYLVQIGNKTKEEQNRILKVASDGTITDSFTYTSKNQNYYITDMIEFNGRVYLSAYSVPALKEGESNAGGRSDIAAVLNPIFENQNFEISKEELTKLVRENFTAELLVCNIDSGEPQEFFSVKGSLGGKLATLDGDKLLWKVESITDTYFSPGTSSFTIGGASYIYNYIFDEGGKILSQEKTSEIVDFRR